MVEAPTVAYGNFASVLFTAANSRAVQVATFEPDLDVPLAAPWRDGGRYLSAVGDPLLRKLERVFDGCARVRAGRVVATPGAAELAIYVEQGPLAGSVVMLLWKPEEPGSVRIETGPLAPAHKRYQWTAFIAGLVLALVLAKYALPKGLLAPEPKFFLALLAGCAIGCGLIVAIRRARVGADMEACTKLTDRAWNAVTGFLDRTENKARARMATPPDEDRRPAARRSRR